MAPTSCPSRAQLDSFQAGTLEEAALATVATHVESCATCQRSLETVIGDSADTVLAALLDDGVASPYVAEAACRVAVERAAALAGESSAGRGGGREAASDDTTQAMPAASIREYRLLAKLGEGGMGAVYKALHTRLDKVVALKVLPSDRIREAGAVARFEREMKAVGRLDHPNIVRAMDAGQEAGTHFLVMEYVDGIDLAHLAKSVGPLPIADACELVRQAALGLAEAHEHGMVHRDIKPSNLILARPRTKKGAPTVKILDLGLALLSEAHAPDQQGLTTTGQMMGTIDYMAPEQGGDSHLVDIRADIYSLGATLHRLLTGSPPFSGERFDTPVKKLMALATQAPPSARSLRPEVPPALAAILDKMLAKIPTDRIATPEELIESLAPFCQNANLAALLQRATSAHPRPLGEGRSEGVCAGAPAAEVGTDAHLSAPSGDTAPTIDRAASSPLPLGEGQDEGAGGIVIQVNRRAGTVAERGSAAQPGRKIPRSLLIAAACGGAALVALLGIVLFLQTEGGTVRIEINDPKIKVVIDNDGNATFTGQDEHKIVLKPGPHGITITRGDLTFGTTSFELKKGERTRLKINYIDGQVHVTKDDKALPAPTIVTARPPGWHGWPADAPPPAIAPFDVAQARQHQEAWAKYLGVPVEQTNSIGMKLRLIPPGEFMMGSTPEEIDEALKKVGADQSTQAKNIRSAGPQHRVMISRPLLFATTEVTVGEFGRFVESGHYVTSAEKLGGGSRGANRDQFDPSLRWNAPGYAVTQGLPVTCVTWTDAVEFCNWLSNEENRQPCYRSDPMHGWIREADADGYRLPTEAEWEYLCRAGTTTAYSFGNDAWQLPQFGWVDPERQKKSPQSVGLLVPNAFGLHDMHGNAGEWCQDWHATDTYQSNFGIDPRGPPTGTLRVVRGGTWASSSWRCSSGYRTSSSPSEPNNFTGFRVVRTLAVPKPIPKAGVPNSELASATGYALEFNGKDSYVDLPTLRYDGSHPITLEARIAVFSSETSGTVITTKGLGLFANGSDAGAKRDFAFFVAGVSGNSRTIHSRQSLPRLVPMCFAAVVEGQAARFFMEGKLQGVTELVTGDQFGGLFMIGGNGVIKEGTTQQLRHPYRGFIDEVRISKVARYDKDYTPKARLEADADTLALYHFDEGQGDVLKDSSGNNHHGKIAGAKWVQAAEISIGP